MRAAYEALPDDLREKITPMKTENTLISSARFDISNPDILKEQLETKKPPTIQPLVRTHPETGTKAIWFHKSKTERIIGMEPAETQDFLDELLEIAIKPEFIYVHEYRLGDLLIVDNRAAMHKAGFDYDHSQHRMLYRMLVRGDRPH
jgi:taurine dioxygenase